MSELDTSVRDLERDLGQAYGWKEAQAIFRSLMTANDRLRYANLRLLNIQQVIREKIAPNFEDWRDTLYVEEPEGVFDQSQRDIRMLATEAVQHLHSAFDPLARAVYSFTVPESTRKILPHKIALHSVHECSDVGFKYRQVLSELSSSDTFFHVAALSNLAKHSYIVRPSFVHFNDEGAPLDAESAIVFQACNGPNWLNKERNLPIDTEFPSKPITQFLKQEILRVIPLFNQIVGLIRSDLNMRLKAEKL